MKTAPVEALLSANTRPVVGPISFIPDKEGKGKGMYRVNCSVQEEPVPCTGARPRQPRVLAGDSFGHLVTEHQLWAQSRKGMTGGEISDLRIIALLER